MPRQKSHTLQNSSSRSKASVATFPKEKGIKIAHLNIRSLKNKKADLELFLRNNPYDFLGISETWLNPDISNDMIAIDGYKFERLDRNSLGGGVGCYVNYKYKYIRRKDLELNDIELMWLEVKRTNSSSLFVGIIYRKPNAKMNFFDNLEEAIERVNSISNNVMILGDFNCNMVTNNTLSNKMNDLCTTTQLIQIIKEPTRVTPHSSSLIDLILIAILYQQ